MKRSKLLLTSSVIFILFTFYVKYSCARSYKEIHHLLTDEEREEIFGHPFAEYVPEYDVLHPVQVDARGRFMSRDLANGNARRKRDIRSTGGFKEPVFFKLSAFGQDFHLNVTINDELFSPNFEIEIRSNGSSEFHYEIDHCHYIGQLLPAKGNENKVAVSNCDGLKGLIRTPQDVFVVHPLPDRLKLAKNNTRAHVMHRRSLSPMRSQSLTEALEKEKRSDSWCGVEGGSAVQQSDESESHLNFVRSSANQKRTIESMIVVEKLMTKFYGVDQIKKYVPTIVNMAHGILADASIGANIKYMIHKLLILEQDMRGLVISPHAASTLTSFCKWTTGQNEQDDKNPIHFDHAALISKYNFCRKKNARAEDCGDILGLADLKGMCKQDISCTLNKDTGLGTAFTLAHETAHNLGAEHDGESNKCNDGVYIMATRASGKLTAFDWSPCSRNYVTKFLQTKQSGCLNDDAKNAVTIPKGLPGQLYDGNDQCVRMFGAGSRVCDIPDLKKKMCVNLHCEKPDGYCSSNDEPAADGTECGKGKWCRRGRCVPVGTKGYQDVDGNWGAWKSWSSCYPRCGTGLNVRVRECDNPAPKGRGKLCEGKGAEYKLCNNAKCQPNEHPRMKQCKEKRNVQFGGGVTYNWIYDPYYSSGKAKCVLNCATTEGDTTTFGNVKDGTPCTDKPNSGLCINGQCETVGCDGAIASRAKTDRCGVCNGDGSTCSGGGNQGNRPKPGKGPKPDKRPKPTKPPTASGQLKKFTYNEKPGFGEYDVVIGTIPAGTRDIMIKEATASENILFLKDTDDNYIINYDDDQRKEIKGAGTTFLFTKQNQKETITAQGPLKMSVTLLYEVYDDWDKYKVNYQYVKPGTQSTRSLSIESDFPDLLREIYEVDKELREAEGQSEDEEKPKMKWIMSSQGCSITCGGGIEVITAVCVREDDESAVGDEFCEEKRPEDITKGCNTQTCPARWEIGEWTECTKSCNDGEYGVRSLEVFCVEDSQGVELEVTDSKCKEPKPTSQEACGKQPCPAEWYTYTEHAGQCSTSCGPGVQPLTVECRRINSSGETKVVDEKECMDIKPPTHVACNVENPCNDQLEA